MKKDPIAAQSTKALKIPAEQRWPVRLLHLADRILCRMYHQTIVKRPLQLPKTGPAILVCNHTSGLDPFLLQAVCPRVIVWMMAKEYYEIRALNGVFRTIECIPVDRAARDTASVRAALRHLADGRVLGVFPEGRIEQTRDLLPFQPGVAQMAIKTGVPVYPAYLDGSQRGKEMVPAFLIPNRATIVFGSVVNFDRSSSTKPTLDAATDKIRQEIEALRAYSLSRCNPWTYAQ